MAGHGLHVCREMEMTSDVTMGRQAQDWPVQKRLRPTKWSLTSAVQNPQKFYALHKKDKYGPQSNGILAPQPYQGFQILKDLKNWFSYHLSLTITKLCAWKSTPNAKMSITSVTAVTNWNQICFWCGFHVSFDVLQPPQFRKLHCGSCFFFV